MATEQEQQMYAQSLQQMAQQKHFFKMQITELDSALKEVQDEKEAFKIIGNIMVKTDAAQLQKELKEKKDLITVRIEHLEKQEKKLQDKLAAGKDDNAQ